MRLDYRLIFCLAACCNGGIAPAQVVAPAEPVIIPLPAPDATSEAAVQPVGYQQLFATPQSSRVVPVVATTEVAPPMPLESTPLSAEAAVAPTAPPT